MNVSLTIAVPLFLVSAAIGVFASFGKRRILFGVFKPLTTLLLLPVVGWPHTTFAWLVVGGILFSLGGDVALLSPAQKAFLVGLVLFLVAHVAYIVAFILASSGTLSSPGVVAALVMAVVTVVLLRSVWSGAAGMHAPLIVYATAIALMVVSAVAGFDPQGGGLPLWAPTGAVLFYLSDSSLALDKFRRPIKHAPFFTLGLYWLGQLGIALATRTLNGS